MQADFFPTAMSESGLELMGFSSAKFIFSSDSVQKYYPEIVWWMNWNYAYSICTESGSNFNYSELLNHPWVINRDEINFH